MALDDILRCRDSSPAKFSVSMGDAKNNAGPLIEVTRGMAIAIAQMVAEHLRMGTGDFHLAGEDCVDDLILMAVAAFVSRVLSTSNNWTPEGFAQLIRLFDADNTPEDLSIARAVQDAAGPVPCPCPRCQAKRGQA